MPVVESEKTFFDFERYFVELFGLLELPLYGQQVGQIVQRDGCLRMVVAEFVLLYFQCLAEKYFRFIELAQLHHAIGQGLLYLRRQWMFKSKHLFAYVQRLF